MLEGGEGFVDARDGELIGSDVEVADCVVYELHLLELHRCGREIALTVAGSSSRSILAVRVVRVFRYG